MPRMYRFSRTFFFSSLGPLSHVLVCKKCVWDRVCKLLSDTVHAAPVPLGRRALREA